MIWKHWPVCKNSQDHNYHAIAQSLDDLKQSCDACVSCDKNENRRYPDNDINETLASLKYSLRAGTLKEQGKYLGALAVQACARCHGTHRIA